MEVIRKVGEAPVKTEYMIPHIIPSSRKPKDPVNDNPITNIDEKEYEGKECLTVPSVKEEVSSVTQTIDICNEIQNGNNKISNTVEKNEETKKLSSLKTEGSNMELQPPKKKQKGQNKTRPRTVPKQKMENRICPSILINEKCKFGEACEFSHNIEEHIKTKGPDIGGVCVNFRRTGKCRYGIECKFSAEHTTEDYKNIIDEEKFKQFCENSNNSNALKKNIMSTVRKRHYKFSRSEKYLSKMNSIEDKCDVNRNTGTSLNQREKKKIDFAGKLYLAPLTTLGNLPFRKICKRFGADITCGEMAMATKLLQCQQAEWALIKRDPSEDIFGVQICGGYPDTNSRVTELLNNECNIDFIDINMGCPIDLVFKKGEGSALMGRLNKLEKIVKGMLEVSDVPITIKMRTGLSENNINAHKVVPLLKEWGIDMITLHGRTREQRYTKDADWDYINKCAELADPVPLFGNGDVLSFEETNMRKKTSGIMIARGALIKPWIFTEIKEQRHWDISSNERFDILQEFTNAGLIHWGSDFKGVENTRRFLLEWLSFLCRYIPVGLLDVLPQKINERAPRYYGRNDLETIFASDNAADWVKISEMLLGPVPDNFTFLPKHKANSYS